MLTSVLLTLVLASLATALSPEKQALFTETLLRDVVDRITKDLQNEGNSYINYPPRLESDEIPEIKAEDLEEQYLGDYGPLLAGAVDREFLPSLRDQEFVQHSSLWGHQFITGGAGEGKQRLKPDGTIKNQKEIKTDAVLPAYCNPPNPCPIDVTEGCIMVFQNTAAFSRDFQIAQDCMCDTEHMFDCSESAGTEPRSLSRAEQRLDHLLMHNFQVEGDDHKSLVAKKFHVEKDGNPFLRGDKLPVAAKKGFDVGY